MSSLALAGGKPTLQKTFKPWNTLDEAEIKACERVIRSGVLSGFVGAWTEAFHGGPEVQSFEREWSNYFKTKNTIAVNSATSGLYAALGAIGLKAGDEVIVTPMSMSASATAPLIYGGIPVFADVDPMRYTLDPASVKERITGRTKAVLAVNLFGHPAHLDELKSLCREHSLYLIEDNAQGPGARFQGRFAGTVADIGVFSLNCHKHIQTGEGGMLVTDSADLAMRLKLIRNHAEAVVEAKGEADLTNMVGYNYRMTELEAAVGRVQLTKLDAITALKRRQAQALHEALNPLEGLTLPIEEPGCESVYYTYALKIDPRNLGVSKETLCRALKAEGVPVISHYVKPLYWAPIFQKRVAFGDYPFSLCPELTYARGLCPVAERLYEKELFYLPWCSYDFTDEDIRLIAEAFKKVWQNLSALKAQ